MFWIIFSHFISHKGTMRASGIMFEKNPNCYFLFPVQNGSGSWSIGSQIMQYLITIHCTSFCHFPIYLNGHLCNNIGQAEQKANFSYRNLNCYTNVSQYK